MINNIGDLKLGLAEHIPATFKKSDLIFLDYCKYSPEDSSKYPDEYLDRFLNYLEENGYL